jgi:hypothetical protein
VAQTCAATCCESSPLWWSFIDYGFLIISAYMVFLSAKKSSKNWVKYGLWITWVLLLIVIANERMGLFNMMNEIVYVPAFGLVGLHLYNRKYCKCENSQCNVNLESSTAN